jgi:hypothetical protein
MELRKRRALLAWVLGMSLCWTALPVGAQSNLSDVPQPWLSYARLTSHQFQAWLEADDDAANQLHRFLEDRVMNAKGTQPPAAVVIRAWIAADGTVSRVEFNSLGDPAADAILRRLLTQHPISEPPPADMPQPLRVRLHIEANPQKDPPASTSIDLPETLATSVCA